MNRREAIGFLGCGAVAAMTGSRGLARAGRERHRSHRATIINGNLVAPIDLTRPLDADVVAQVRSAGLTAFKLTLGGSGNQSKAETEAEIVEVSKGIAMNPGLYRKIVSIDDLAACRRTGTTGIIYSFEAAEMLDGNIDNIDHFRAAGVLVMGLSYNRTTPFASGVLSQHATGLTAAGHDAVERMNASGVTIDLSHSDERSTLGALAASRRPVTITHAGCGALHPHPRNKSDAVLRALAEHGGVVGIYELSYLVPPPRQPTLEDYLRHLLHAMNVCGEDHVAIGTDGQITPFDTSRENMTAWYAEIERRKATGVGAPGEGPPPFAIGLNRPDRCRVIGDALNRHGYPPRIVDKILGKNLERVFGETWTQGLSRRAAFFRNLVATVGHRPA